MTFWRRCIVLSLYLFTRLDSSRISSSYTLSDRSVFVQWSKLKKVHVAEYFLDGGFRHRHINSIWFDAESFVTALVCVYASMKFACTAYILYTCNVAYIGNAVYLGKIMPRWITHLNPPQKDVLGCFCTGEPVQLVGRVVMIISSDFEACLEGFNFWGSSIHNWYFSCWKVFGFGRELLEFFCHRFRKSTGMYGICFLQGT